MCLASGRTGRDSDSLITSSLPHSASPDMVPQPSLSNQPGAVHTVPSRWPQPSKEPGPSHAILQSLPPTAPAGSLFPEHCIPVALMEHRLSSLGHAHLWVLHWAWFHLPRVMYSRALSLWSGNPFPSLTPAHGVNRKRLEHHVKEKLNFLSNNKEWSLWYFLFPAIYYA